MSILPQLEEDLRRAAQRQLDRAAVPGRPERQKPASPAIIAIARRVTAFGVPLLIVLAVAGTAIVLLHGAGSPPTAARPNNPDHQRLTGRSALIASLEVLRRKQTPADLNPKLLPSFVALSTRPAGGDPSARAFLRRQGDPRLDRSLVRVVSVPRLHAKVSIAPMTYRRRGTARRRVEGLYVDATAPGTILQGQGPISVSSFLAHGIDLGVEPHNERVASLVLVPDGVARVRLGQLVSAQRLPGLSRGAVNAALKMPPQIATVHDNVAAFDLPLPGAITGSPSISGRIGIDATASTTWYSASGKVLRQVRVPTDITITVHG